MKMILPLFLTILVSCGNPKLDRKMNGTKTEKTKTAAELKKELMDKGYEIFDYVDDKTKDTVLMQQYYIAFLKSGPNRSQSKEQADNLQSLHLAHLGRMYELGYADISGPFGDDGEIRGITIYITRQLWKWQIALPTWT
ncbi:hypothetical protein GCM10011412_14480 [Maribacter cobaltidurans]|nr:hypothetical protein GCM10011412_14480 [Maribacter cobaltidurans]